MAQRLQHAGRADGELGRLEGGRGEVDVAADADEGVLALEGAVVGDEDEGGLRRRSDGAGRRDGYCSVGRGDGGCAVRYRYNLGTHGRVAGDPGWRDGT